jgi:hypothetical protein
VSDPGDIRAASTMPGGATPRFPDDAKAALSSKESNVLTIGGLLVSVAIVTLAAVAPAFRSADPPQWTRRGWVGELVTLAIVCTLAIGVGYLGAGMIAAVQTGPDFLDVALLAGVLFVAVMFWRRLNARVHAGASAVAVVAPAPAAPAAPRAVIAEPPSRAA